MTSDVREHLQTMLGAAYTLERELGGGGMSRVFVAEETALGRTVVVKVLPHDLAEGLSAERFKREVRLAARLQHPHIVPLLTSGALADGLLYYSMPFVDGEGLDARLAREGALPVADAVALLRDIASALAYAHRHHVVHRDVKPANVLLSDGGAVVTDFGIAKAVRAARASSTADAAGDSRSATITQLGTSVGTPQYMAPEQVAGGAVDHRADLYALGVVAYEMLAGRPPFDGRAAQQLLAAHAVEVPEPLVRRRPNVPAALGALVMRLLEKNPADRPQSADDVLRALDGLADAPRAEIAKGAGLRWPRAAVAWALIGAVLGAALGAWFAPGRVAPSRPVVAALLAPESAILRAGAGYALSADGTHLAFVADQGGDAALWVRALDSAAATRVAGSENGQAPFWSPDGASLGFFAGGQLKVADLRGGPPRALCPAPRPGGGTWTQDGVIVYAPNAYGGGLFRVPAAGGPCAQLTRLRPGDSEHRRPSALPDGRRVLFSTVRSHRALAADLATGAITEVRQPGGDAQFVEPDWLLFRDDERGVLYAQRLDLRTLRPIGEARVVLDGLTREVAGNGGFAASARVLVASVAPRNGQFRVVWVDRQSVVQDSVLAPAGASGLIGGLNIGLSHDGRWVAFGGRGLWLHERARGVATRIPLDSLGTTTIGEPAWSPGDSLIAFATLLGGPPALHLYHVRTGASEQLFSSGQRNVRAPDWSPDGRRIAFQLSAGDSVALDEIWVYSLAERRATRLWRAASLMAPSWAPDGQWLAYVSAETGAAEVYVRPVAGPGPGLRVSSDGGESPRWRADGRELYYRAPNGAIMAVAVRLGPVPVLSAPRLAVSGVAFSRNSRGFQVTPEGARFVASAVQASPPTFRLLLDWTARLPRP